MANKRPRGDPTGLTPVQASKKPASKLKSLLTGHQMSSTVIKKSLFHTKTSGKRDISCLWTPEEEASLVQYLLNKGYKEWPKSHPPCPELWEGAARFLCEKGHAAKRTSK